MFVHAIESEGKKILGSNDNRVFFRALTQAVQILMERGHWFHTTAQADIRTGWDRCTLTLPKEVGVPLSINIDGSPCYFRGRNFQFHINGGGKFYPVPWAWDDQGQVPVMMDPRSPSELVAVAQLESDAGKSIRVLGKSRGVEIVSQTLDGLSVPGLLVPIRPPWNFAEGVPLLPDGVRLESRQASVSRIDSLHSLNDEPLGFLTGALVELTLRAGAVAPQSYVGRSYFLRVSSDRLSIQLYTSRLAALNSVSPVALDSFEEDTELTVLDSRSITTKTKLEALNHGISTPTPVTILASTFPSGISASTVYYVNSINASDLQLFRTSADALVGDSPIYLKSAGSNVVLRARRPAAVIASLRSSSPHGLVTGDAVFMDNVGGVLPEPLRVGVAYYARVTGESTITVHSTLGESLSGANPIALTSAGTGTSSFFKLLPCTAVLGSLNNISCPSHNLPLSADTLVRVVSEGTYPDPLNATTAYFVNPGGNVNTVTIKSNPATPINITSVGAGNLYLSLVRTFSLDFGSAWSLSTQGLSTGDQMFLSADALIPVTSPSIDSSTPVYVRLLGEGRVEFYNSQANAVAAPSTTGRINVVSLGAGSVFADRPIEATVEPLDSMFEADSTGYIDTGAVVRLSTSGTLPSPLLPDTDYRISVIGNSVQVRSFSDDAITLTDVGDGEHKFQIQHDVYLRPATQISVTGHALSTGDEVVFAGEHIPAPLNNTDSQFVRWSSENAIELYDTLENAKNIGSIVGRVAFFESDGTLFDLVKKSTPVLVDSIYQIDKPVTVGSVTLYAWDLHNSSELTLLGTYGPLETQPSYRRVRLGKPCAWARVLYRVTAPNITSLDDYIPIQHERAVLTALRAVDLENKNFLAQSAAYWDLAVRYLTDQHESLSGHAAEPPQIQSYGYGSDDVEFLV